MRSDRGLASFAVDQEWSNFTAVGDELLLDETFAPDTRLSGLAIYAARGLWSRTAEITAVASTVCGGWQFFSKNEMRKVDIFQVV